MKEAHVSVWDTIDSNTKIYLDKTTNYAIRLWYEIQEKIGGFNVLRFFGPIWYAKDFYTI